MKGIQGLIVAIALGAAGAAANFYYLNTEAQKKDMIGFIGIKKGVLVASGDRLTEDKLVEVEIPANNIGKLKEYAFLWKERVGVKDIRVWRALDTRESEDAVLLLRSDFKTPPPELELGEGEKGEFIAVPRNFDTSHLNPGDKISFRIWAVGPTPAPKPAAAVPTASVASGTADVTGAADVQPQPEEPAAPTQIVGPGDVIEPFVVVSVGNRLGTLDVMKAAKIAPVQQNVLMIRVSKHVKDEEQKFDKLMTSIQRFGPNCYTISLLGK